MRIFHLPPTVSYSWAKGSLRACTGASCTAAGWASGRTRFFFFSFSFFNQAAPFQGVFTTAAKSAKLWLRLSKNRQVAENRAANAVLQLRDFLDGLYDVASISMGLFYAPPKGLLCRRRKGNFNSSLLSVTQMPREFKRFAPSQFLCYTFQTPKVKLKPLGT